MTRGHRYAGWSPPEVRARHFGGGKVSAPPPPPPPPQVTDPSIAQAGAQARANAKKRKGRAGTLLAGEQPFTPPDETLSGKATLGG